MTLHTIMGYMNSGKTQLLSIFGYKAYKKGRIIYSNYPLNFPHKLINRDFIIQLGKDQPSLFNITFLLDEFWIWFDCRASGKDNQFATNFILQSSKEDTDILMTTQDNRQNDVRIRNNQHLITVTKRKVLINGVLKHFDNLQRILPPEIQDILYINYKTYEYKLIGIERVLILKEQGNIKAKPFFCLYNTHTKIKYGDK